jgi:hypothetical protein
MLTPMVRPNPAPRPAVNPMMVSLAAPAAPRLKGPTPKAAVSALLGDLSHTSPMAPLSVIKVELPNHLEGAEIEVVVQIRQGEKILAQGLLKRTVPSAGAISRLTLELKRS